MTRGWKGNALRLQKWEVEACHQTRLDATDAIAQRMLDGDTFAEAKAAVIRRGDLVYKASRPELYAGHRAMVRDVQFSDMPDAVLRKIEDRALTEIERGTGRRLGPFSRWLYRRFGVVL